MKQKVRESKYGGGEKIDSLSRVIKHMGEERAELEEIYMKLRSQYFKVQLNMDEAVTRASSIQEILDVLRKSNQSELSDKLIELADRLQGTKL